MNRTPKSYTEEYIPINDIQEYMLHYPASPDRPVLLFIHGGPGTSEAFFAYETQRMNKNDYTLVHYDQRGTGKTFLKNPKATLCIENILEDLQETVLYLKKKYKKEQITILGHSWGSLLGSLYAKRHPENIDLYIGVGQFIDLIENERGAYQAVKSAILKSGNKKDIHTLKKIGEYPNLPFNHNSIEKMKLLEPLERKYKTSMSIPLPLLKIMMKSPIFQLTDLTASIKTSGLNNQLLIEAVNLSLYQYDRIYQVPICYIMGDQDFLTPYPVAQKYFREIEAPSKRFLFIRGAGHFPMLEKPKSFAGALKKALELPLMLE